MTEGAPRQPALAAVRKDGQADPLPEYVATVEFAVDDDDVRRAFGGPCWNRRTGAAVQLRRAPSNRRSKHGAQRVRRRRRSTAPAGR